MKTAHFKKHKIKQKLIYACLFSIILCFYNTYKLTKYISKNIIYVSEKMIIAETDLAYNDIFTIDNLNNIDTNNLINIIKNKNDEITEVDFDINEGEKILTNVVDAMNKKTGRYMSEGYIMEVPIGYITSNPLFVNLGPKIPIKIMATDVVYGNVKTRITEYGINNAMVEVYLELNIKINVALPIVHETYSFSYNYLLASKIINGKVPDFYGGIIDKKSENINLPIM